MALEVLRLLRIVTRTWVSQASTASSGCQLAILSLKEYLSSCTSTRCSITQPCATIALTRTSSSAASRTHSACKKQELSASCPHSCKKTSRHLSATLSLPSRLGFRSSTKPVVINSQTSVFLASCTRSATLATRPRSG